MSRAEQRFTSLRLLELLRTLAAKAEEMKRLGIQLAIMTELHEEVGGTLVALHGIDPAQANALWLSLNDFTSGLINCFEMVALIAGTRAVVKICDDSKSK